MQFIVVFIKSDLPNYTSLLLLKLLLHVYYSVTNKLAMELLAGTAAGGVEWRLSESKKIRK